MNRSEVFKAAHKLAKTFVGSYVACFAMALKSIYRSVKMVEVKLSMSKTFCGKGVIFKLSGDNGRFGKIDPAQLGYKMLTTNEWRLHCYTPAEIDAARDPLKAFVTNRRAGTAVILEA